MKPFHVLLAAIVLASLAVSIAAYGQVPERMASHWNINGEVDGYMPKLLGLGLFPAVLAGLSLLFMAIPRIDPLRANIREFLGYYQGFTIVISGFFLAVQLMVVLWNVGVMISPNIVMPAGVGILFYYAGVLIEHSKRNWFIGIRTPWTLSSDVVWEKTHRIGGKLFKASGLISLAGVVLPAYAFYLIIAPVLASAVYTIAYSYVEYGRVEGRRAR
jgi:uncharacterized membrane protein